MPSPQKIQFTELADWMAKRGVDQRWLGKASRLDKMTINRLLNGTFKRFDPQIIPKISIATDAAIGQAQFAAFFERLAQPRPKRRAA